MEAGSLGAGSLGVGGLDGGECFKPQRFEAQREFFFSDLRHDDEACYEWLSLRIQAVGEMQFEC